MASKVGNATPGKNRGRQNAPYNFEPVFERGVVYLACTQPRFMARVAHELRPELLGLPECKLALEAAQTIFRETEQSPTSWRPVLQEVASKRDDGKITTEQVKTVLDLFDHFDDKPLPKADEYERGALKAVKSRLRFAIAQAGIDEHGGEDWDKVEQLRAREEALSDSGDWPEPTPLAPTEGPAFPVDALPTALGTFALALAEALQVPLDMTAAAVLGALSTAAARKAFVQAAPSHVEPLNLFVAIVSPSGQRKSAVFRDATKPLADYERAKADERAKAVRECKVEREKLEEERKAKAKDGGKGDWRRVREIDDEIAQLPELHHYRLLTADATPQALGTLLYEQGERMTVLDAEPGAFETMAGRWSGAEPELNVYLRGHAGDSLRVDRKGRPPEYVQAPALSLLLGAQPNAVRRLASVDGALERGLLGRFLWCVAHDVRGARDVRRALPVPDADARAYSQCLHGLLNLPAPLDTAELPRLTFDAEAQELWFGFAEDVENRLKPGRDLRDISGANDGWGEKFAGLTARIAGLFHLGAQVSAPTAAKTSTLTTAPSTEIAADTLRMAIAVGKWALAHARVAFGVAGSSRGSQAAEAILAHVRQARVEESSRHEVHLALRGTARWSTAAALTPGFNLLEERGWIRSFKQAPSAPKKGGRPSSRFTVHPKALELTP